MRVNYWSCSKFANWLRGTAKPHAATSGEWKSWTKEAKTKHPVRYWIAEEGLDHLQNFINWPNDRLNDIKYYINNRWISRSHALTAHPSQIKPGAWSDVGYRFLPCMFNELVDFVEVETAWHHCLWDKEARAKYNPPWYRTSWFNFRGWRCPEAGIAHLTWAAGLTVDDSWGVEPTHEEYGQPTHQALAAKEILELYTWWKEVYLNRPDPYEASGWTEICAKHREDKFDIFDTDNLSTEDKRYKDQSLELLNKIEEEYEAEEENMMIRLIKIRKALWT